MMMSAHLYNEAKMGCGRGWAYTPLSGKAPILNGWQVADKAPWQTVAKWVEDGHNLGLRTGIISGVLVVDIEAGAPTDLSKWPHTWTVRTGGGGLHLYYRATVESGNRSGTLVDQAGQKIPQVDLRGNNGQVVAVGSVHPDTGMSYQWHRDLSPWDVTMADFPAWCLNAPARVTPPVARPIEDLPGNAVSRCMAYLDRCPDAVSGSGGHNATFLAACTCWRFGLPRADVYSVMAWFNTVKCKPLWSERELEHKIESAWRQVSTDGTVGELLNAGRPEQLPIITRF